MTALVCYLVQTHRDAEQIYRLVRTLRAGSPHGLILVRHDVWASPLDWTPLAGLPRTHLLPGTARQFRGHYSCQMQGYLDAIAWLERQHVPYDWLVNLTGQDYPLKPLRVIEESLGASTRDGFLTYWDLRAPGGPWSWRKARRRYWYRYARLPDGAMPWLRALRPLTRFLPLHFYLDYGPLVGVPAWRTPFGASLRCHGGWPWWSLRRRAALYLRDFLAAHPAVEKHYRRTIIPEESLVQTLLVNAGTFDLVNDDLRFVDYSAAQAGRPRTLTVADLPALAGGGDHFARKFDLAVDREVLDRIDRELLGLPAADFSTTS